MNKVSFTDYFIRRPVLASALSIFILLIGLFSIFNLPLRLFPKVEVPVINITTTYTGASADVVQNFITTTLQNAIVGLEGVDYISSKSSQSSSSIDVYLKLGANPDVALNAISSKINGVRSTLPGGIDDPVIKKTDPDDQPALIIAFTSQVLSNQELGDYLTRAVKPQLEAVDGVAHSDVWGDTYAMRIWINPDLMTGFGITANDVSDALQKQNVQASPGNTQGDFVNYGIHADTDIHTATAFNNIVVKQVGSTPIKIRDIGQAELGPHSDTVSAFVNGKPATMMGIYMMPGANPLQVLRRVRDELPEIQKHLPAGVNAKIVYDTSLNIQASLHEVIKSIFFAIFIVVAVIFLFIRRPRAVMIPVITIPLSLIGVCFFMNLLGYSLNSLTLLAMVLAIGLVVDDSIVVMENIVRHMEAGMSSFHAALKGAREIAVSVIAMTITLAAVYAPIGFTGGLTGFLFAEFAYTLAGAVIISGIIALTLSPMMCSKLLANTSQNISTHKPSVFFNKILEIYYSLLQKTLKRRKLIIMIWLLILMSSIFIYRSIPAELAPQEDPGYLQIISSAPAFTNASFIKHHSARMNDIFKSLSSAENSVYINGIPSESQVLSFVLLKPWEKRSQKIEATQMELQQKLSQISGLDSMVIVPSALPATSEMPLGFVVKSLGSYQELYHATEALKTAAQESGLFLFITSDLQYDKPQLNLHINRKAATDLSVNIDDIAHALSLMLSNYSVQKFVMQGFTYDVIMQAFQAYRTNPETLNKINVRSQNGSLIPLSALVDMSTRVEPMDLNQFQKFNAVTLSGMMAPGHSLSEGLKFLKQKSRELLPSSITFDYVGESRHFLQEAHRMLWTFSLAILVIFLVLAMQFESYRDPLIILFGSVPMAFFAGLLFLKFGFSTLNIYTQIGLLTLVGLISKHGILLTKFANELRYQQGLNKFEAITQAAFLRLRPILMTTMAMVFGTIPLLIAHGAGSNSRFAMGIVITSGLVIGTLFTLFVVPVIYTLISKTEVLYKAENHSAKSSKEELPLYPVNPADTST